MTILNNQQLDDIIQRQREDATRGLLLGLCLAAISGAVMGAVILLTIQWLFP